MRYKLLAIDIDDTLVNEAKQVSEINKKAIRDAEDAGVYVTLATGRGYSASSLVSKQIGLDKLIINYGGAMINDAATDKPFMVTELECGVVNEIMELAESMGLHSHLYQGDGIVCERKSEYPVNYSKTLRLPLTIEPNVRRMVWHNVPKVLIMTEPERVSELLQFFRNRFEGRVAVFASSPGFIEFNKIGASKGSALKILAEHLGISREETAAIGDNTLDLPMIEWAGLGACVENGNEAVKAAADIVVPSCSENGVARFIYDHILVN